MFSLSGAVDFLLSVCGFHSTLMQVVKLMLDETFTFVLFSHKEKTRQLNFQGNQDRELARNCRKMMLLRHLGKSISLKAYPCTVRHVKDILGSGFFCLGFFCLQKISMNRFLGHFQRAKTMLKLLWNSENVINIAKALNVKENIK